MAHQGMADDGFLFDRVAIVGLGLIGSSLAWRLTGRSPAGASWTGPRLAGEVIGHDADPTHLARAAELGFVDRAEADIAAAVAARPSGRRDRA